MIGVAAAFGAPIGGMLFALEEVASFWNPSLNWRTFFTAAVANFTVLAILSCYNGECGVLDKEGLISFDGNQVTDLGIICPFFFCFFVL